MFKCIVDEDSVGFFKGCSCFDVMDIDDDKINEMGEFEDEFEDEFESEDEIIEVGIDGRLDVE